MTTSRIARFAVVLASLGALACGGEETSDRPSPAPAEEPTPEPPTPEPPAPVVPPAPLEPPPASRLEQVGPYRADVGRDCDGFPYLSLRTAPGLCVGLVLHKESPDIVDAGGRFRPRTLVEDPVRDGVLWVADHGARRANAGRVFRMEERDGRWRAERVLRRLNRPHQSRVGADGWIYVGEVQRIVRFDPRAADPAATREVVIDDLPIELPNRPLRFHPMTAFVFAPDQDLIVNMGSGTDRCLEGAEEDRCHDEAEDTAAIWRFDYLGDRRWASEHTVLARGLRNSMALAAHPTGTVLQAENGVDFREESRPHEELNVIVPGGHYGWPYCWDRRERDPRWAHSSFGCGEDNAAYTPPHLLLPPHGAPLDLLYYPSAHEGADALNPIAGQLIVSLHGYRRPGHRLLTFAVDDEGIPAADAEPSELIAGWDAGDDGPRGSPVGMTVARDGSLWLVEDTNGTVLRVAPDRWAASREGARPAVAATTEVVLTDAFTAVHQQVLRPRCSECHDFVAADPTEALAAITREGWLRPEDGEVVVANRTSPSAARQMPPGAPLTSAQRAVLATWLAEVQASP